MNNQNICRAGDCRKTVFSTPCAASNFSTINMANNTTTKPVFETACADMDEDEVRLLMAECAADGCIKSVAITEDRKYIPLRRKTFPPKPMPANIPLDGLEREYLETHPPYPKLIKKFPHLKGLSVSKWYSAIPHDFAANNPRLMQTLFNISEEAQTDIKDTLQLCPSMRDEMHRELAEYDHLAHAAEVGGLPQIAGLPQAVFEDTTTQGGSKRRKHIPFKQAIGILEGLNCPKDRKTLQRWMSGTNTPDDFTPEKMQSVEAFTAWATIYSRREQSKINTNNALRIDNSNNRKMTKFR